jgi:hypothetical protein
VELAHSQRNENTHLCDLNSLGFTFPFLIGGPPLWAWAFRIRPGPFSTLEARISSPSWPPMIRTGYEPAKPPCLWRLNLNGNASEHDSESY